MTQKLFIFRVDDISMITYYIWNIFRLVNKDMLSVKKTCIKKNTPYTPLLFYFAILCIGGNCVYNYNMYVYI
jgi:hypothetical protein